MTVAYGYARQSNKGNTKSVSIPTQVEGIERYCAEHDYDLRDVLVDMHTGTELFERESFTKLRELMRAGSFDVLVLWDSSRFSRDEFHTIFMQVESTHYGVRLEFIDGDNDDSEMGRLFRILKGWAGRQELERIKRHTWETKMTRLRNNGQPFIGRVPLYGYVRRADGLAFLPDAAAAPVVRRIFREASDGKPLRQIAKDLNDEGVVPGTQGRWWAGRLSNMLRHPAYKGEGQALRWQGTKVRGKNYSYSMKLRDPAETVQLPADVYPALVDAETWNLVGRRLDRSRQESARRNPNPTASLLRAGFATCGTCGRKMSVSQRTNHPGVYDYRCNYGYLVPGACKPHRHRVDEVDQDVWNYVTLRLLDPAVIDHELSIRQGTKERNTADLDGIDRAVGILSKQVDNLVRAVQDSTVPEAVTALTARLNQLSAQKESLLTERLRLEERYAHTTAATDFLQYLRDHKEEVYAILRNGDLSYQGRRDLLVRLDVRVKMYARQFAPLDTSTGQPLSWTLEADPGPLLGDIATQSSRRLEHNVTSLSIPVSWNSYEAQFLRR